ncbi:retrovirus-related pol polyprotein from transposon TNT 1-94 [Tanacetum coccineum]
MKGVGLSFPDFLLVRYEGCQLNDLVWGQSYVVWYKENSHDNKPRPRDYTFREWMIVKVGHKNVNESVKKALLKSWVIDYFEEALDPNKDLIERSFDDYKWSFDLEIKKLADEYELGIGKKGHILEMIWENYKNIQGKAKEWWYDYWLEEDEKQENEDKKYDPPMIHLETFEVPAARRKLSRQTRPIILWENELAQDGDFLNFSAGLLHFICSVAKLKTAHDMWIAIERIQQGESLNIQDVKTNLLGCLENSLLMMESQWSYTTLVNEIRAERIAKNASPLALVAAAQQYSNPYYQAPKSHKSYAPTSKQSSSTRSNATTKLKGKEIAKPITTPSESTSEEDSDPEQTYKNDNQTGQFGNQRIVTVAGARESVGSQVVQQSGIQCFNCKEFCHFAKECMKQKRVKDYTYQKEKMLLCKQAEKGVPLQAKQADWLEGTNKEIDKQELEEHYSFMAKIQKVLPPESNSTVEPLERVQYNGEYNMFAHER